MKRGLKISIASLLTSIGLIFGLMTYSMTKMDIETLILCSSNEDGSLIPGRLCETYMFNYRAHPQDITALNNGAGLIFILNGRDEENKYKTARFFITKGVDINGINHHGEHNITPLYAAILYNDFKMLHFLLLNGADQNVTPPSINLSPLAFAESLQNKKPSIDRSKVIALLSQQ